jgi:hypothetical protein
MIERHGKRLALTSAGGRGRHAQKSGAGMTTATEAIADYHRLKAEGLVTPAIPAPDPAAERQAAAEYAVRLLVPAFRAAEVQRASAAVSAAEAERRASLPPPRDVLREAHSRRGEAKAEADRLRTQLDRAKSHLADVAAARDEATRSLVQGR